MAISCALPNLLNEVLMCTPAMLWTSVLDITLILSEERTCAFDIPYNGCLSGCLI